MLSKRSKTWSQRPACSFKAHVYLFILIYLYIIIKSVQIRKSKRLYENVSINDKEFFTYEGTGTLGEYGMLFYIEHVCVLTRKRRNKLKKSIEGKHDNFKSKHTTGYV